MNPPFPKWVYDVVMEMLHCNSTGTPVDTKSVLAAVPDGMKFACQGVMDYYTLAGAMMPVAGTPETPAPAAEPATPAVVSLSDLGINMAPSPSVPPAGEPA